MAYIVINITNLIKEAIVLKFREIKLGLIIRTVIILATVLSISILLTSQRVLAENTEIVSHDITDVDIEEEYYVEELEADSIIKEEGPVQKKILVAHYKFDEDLRDSSDNENHGNIAHGEITYENGKNGKAAKFDGESYIEIGDNNSLNLDKAFTISTWLYKTEDEEYGYSPVIAKGTGSETVSPPYILYYDGAIPNPYLDLHNHKEWDSLSIEDKGEERFNKWYLLTVTFDSYTGKINFYIDGAFIGYKSWNYGALYNTDQSLYIGFGELDGMQEFYLGLMDDLRIYNYALTDKEIKAIYKEVIAENKVYTAISITPNKMALIKAKGVINLNVTGITSDGKKDVISNKASYKSSDDTIVTVSKEGKIEALKKGKATVTVSYGKLKKVLN